MANTTHTCFEALHKILEKVQTTKHELEVQGDSVANTIHTCFEALHKILEKVQTTKHELEVQGDSVANTIHTCFEALHKILEKHKQELLEDAMRIVGEKRDKLSQQEKNLSLANAKVQSVGDYT